MRLPLDRLPLDRLGLGGWDADPWWGSVYDWSVEHRTLGGLGWRAAIDSDLGRLYAATDEIGAQRAGSAVLDVPCGGGVALRGLRRGQGVRYVAVDISEAMLQRTRNAATERGVAYQVETVRADVTSLPFEDGEFDLVVSFTGLHCFPDPHAAVLEMGRVTHPDGALTGSWLRADAPGLRAAAMRLAGGLSRLLGPSATAAQVREWLSEAGFDDVRLDRSGAMGYFHAARRP